MGVGKSAFYQWAAQRDRVKPAGQLALEQKAAELFDSHRKTVGSRRLQKELKKSGFPIGRYKTRRLMKQLGLVVRYPRRYKSTTDSRHDWAIAPNTLARQFIVSTPNTVWITDITYVWTRQGWLYLAVVLKLFSRRVVGWAMAEHMQTSLCLQALQMAYERRKPAPGLVHHSDRGSQYASDSYRQRLTEMGMEASMSGKGQCWDNAPIERFFRSLKYECLNHQRFPSRQEAGLSVLDYFAYYNSRRPHSILGYLSPMQYEHLNSDQGS